MPMEVIYTSPECKIITLWLEKILNSSSTPEDHGLPGFGGSETHPEDDQWEIDG